MVETISGDDVSIRSTREDEFCVTRVGLITSCDKPKSEQTVMKLLDSDEKGLENGHDADQTMLGKLKSPIKTIPIPGYRTVVMFNKSCKALLNGESAEGERYITPIIIFLKSLSHSTKLLRVQKRWGYRNIHSIL